MYVGAPSPSHAAQQAPLQPPHLPPAPRREIPQGRPREAAKKALKQVRNVPANLTVYAIAAAAILILVMAIVLILHINRLNRDADSLGPASLPAPAASSAPPASEAIAPSEAEPAALQPEPSPRAASSGRSAKKKSPAAPVVIPGQMSIDSTPQGAQVQIDGKADSAWITPFTLSGLSPGQHTVTVSKAGYSPDTRAVEVIAGSKSFVVTHLNQLMATLSVNSTPPGASVYIDGRDSGKLTPAQLSVDRGQHTVLVRKSGFLDETITAQFVLAQTVSFSPTLRPLGNVDDIRTVNRLKKLFGGREAQGMGTISVRTQPKGAQVAINQHVMDKLSPIDLMLDPGNYIVDVTLTGYIPIHKEITVEKGSKTAIDEVMQHD